MNYTGEIPKIKVVALDDEPKRETTYRLMEDDTLEVEFIDLKGKNTSEEIVKLGDELRDIFFVDHRLDNASKESVVFMPTGECITPILREKWPKAPIFGVTAAKPHCMEHDGNNFFEEVFDIDDIDHLLEFVPSVVDGYQKLRASISSETRIVDFVALLNAPEDVIESIIHNIPDKLECLGVDNFTHAIYRWFRRNLHARAGFLYNKEWTAVTMGIAVEHFEKYESAFVDAKYAGLWCDPGEIRWWQKGLYELAISERKSPRESVQFASCQLLDINEQHYSQCFKCRERWPEVLAFTDDGPLAELVPAHLECSKPHPRGFVSLSFEEPRIVIE